MIRARVPILGLAIMASATLDAAEAPDGHDAALAAVRAGKIVPLHEMLALPAVRGAGVVVEVELERRPNRWIYEIEAVAPDGTLRKLHFDATTRELLPAEKDED